MFSMASHFCNKPSTHLYYRSSMNQLVMKLTITCRSARQYITSRIQRARERSSVRLFESVYLFLRQWSSPTGRQLLKPWCSGPTVTLLEIACNYLYAVQVFRSDTLVVTNKEPIANSLDMLMRASVSWNTRTARRSGRVVWVIRRPMCCRYYVGMF